MTTTHHEHEVRLAIEYAENELLNSLTEMRRLLRLLPRGAQGREQISELSRSILALEERLIVCQPWDPPCGEALCAEHGDPRDTSLIDEWIGMAVTR